MICTTSPTRETRQASYGTDSDSEEDLHHVARIAVATADMMDMMDMIESEFGPAETSHQYDHRQSDKRCMLAMEKGISRNPLNRDILEATLLSVHRMFIHVALPDLDLEDTTWTWHP